MTELGKRRSDFEEILVVTLIVISCFFAFTYFLTAVLGPTIFFFTSEGAATSVKHLVNGLPIWLFVVISFYIPVMPTVGEVFLFLAGAFFLCLLAAWKFRESFHNVIRKSSSRPIGKLFNNFLVAMPIITSMLLTAVLAITSLQSSAGFPTEPPPMEEPPFIQLFSFSYAAFIEEIGFRISPIGLFLIIRMFGARMQNEIVLSGKERLKLFFASLIYPDRAKKTVGLKTVSDFGIRGGISRGEWIMIFLTAFAWGLAHYLVGGWTVGKITSVFVDGLIFGLTYIAYGAYAPILLHWFFNYYLSILGSDLSLNYYPYLLPMSFLAMLLMFAIGIAGWIGFAIIGVKKLLKMETKQSMPPPPPPLDQT
jgi:hypothetical protein